MAITPFNSPTLGSVVETTTISSVVVPSGARLLLGVVFASSTAPTSIAANYNTSEALGNLHSGSTGSGANGSYYWTAELITPTAGTHDIVLTWTGTRAAVSTVLVLTGYDTNAASSLGTATAASSTPSITNTSSSGKETLTYGMFRDTSGPTGVATTGSPAVLYGEAPSGTGASHVDNWWWQEAGAASVTTDGTLDASRTWRLYSYELGFASSRVPERQIGAGISRGVMR